LWVADGFDVVGEALVEGVGVVDGDGEVFRAGLADGGFSAPYCR